MVWLYYGEWVEETRRWAYRQVSLRGELCLERYLVSD